MQIGLTLPTYRRLADPAHIVATAEMAEAYGFHSLWSVDHIVMPVAYADGMVGSHGNLGATFYDCLTTLAFVAARTTRVRLGLSVMPIAYRHPLLQAKMFATLDQLSGGRAIYAGAAGYLREEFEALGVDFAHRGDVSDEYLQAIKALWTEPRPEFHGRYVDFADVYSEPKPVQRPHPPIWIGGDSDGAFRRVVRFGDGWHAQLTSGPTLDSLRPRIARLHELARREGRDPATIRISLKHNCVITDASAAERPFTGTVGQVLDDIRRAEEIGVEIVVFSPNVARGDERMDTIDVIGRDIIPRLG